MDDIVTTPEQGDAASEQHLPIHSSGLVQQQREQKSGLDLAIIDELTTGPTGKSEQQEALKSNEEIQRRREVQDRIAKTRAFLEERKLVQKAEELKQKVEEKRRIEREYERYDEALGDVQQQQM